MASRTLCDVCGGPAVGKVRVHIEVENAVQAGSRTGRLEEMDCCPLCRQEAITQLSAAAGTKYDRRAIKALMSLNEKLQATPTVRGQGAIVRGQGTSSICIRT